MKKTIQVCSSNRALEDRTRESINALQRLGAPLVHQKGSADVAYARNLALTGVCHFLDRNPDFDVVLMVDDDVVFSVDQVLELLEDARHTGIPASAVYGSINSVVCAQKYSTRRSSYGRQLWLTGLGLLAIPVPALRLLQKSSERFAGSLLQAEIRECYEFTWTGVLEPEELIDDEGFEWRAEDYRLCARMGGVHLLPIGIGHMKKVELLPDLETLKNIADA